MIELILALFLALASPAQKPYHANGDGSTQVQAQDDDGGDDSGDDTKHTPPPPPPPGS